MKEGETKQKTGHTKSYYLTILFMTFFCDILVVKVLRGDSYRCPTFQHNGTYLLNAVSSFLDYLYSNMLYYSQLGHFRLEIGSCTMYMILIRMMFKRSKVNLYLNKTKRVLELEFTPILNSSVLLLFLRGRQQ